MVCVSEAVSRWIALDLTSRRLSRSMCYTIYGKMQEVIAWSEKMPGNVTQPQGHVFEAAGERVPASPSTCEADCVHVKRHECSQATSTLLATTPIVQCLQRLCASASKCCFAMLLKTIPQARPSKTLVMHAPILAITPVLDPSLLRCTLTKPRTPDFYSRRCCCYCFTAG